MVAALLATVAVFAQYAIEWETIDGGGTIATGGDFDLNGTIGQHDAGIAAGGDFELVGGFWAIAAIQVNGAPWLNIALSGGTNVVVSWTANLSWVLQFTDDLTTTNWTDATSGSTNPIAIPAGSAARFYRLRKLP